MVVLTRKMKISCFVFALCFARSLTAGVWNSEKYLLPDEFRFGVASSAYQIEGAWNEDGKGESIWDRYFQTHPERFAPGPNATDACDSYHNYKRDVEMLREIGADFYRFSVSWSRILPTGTMEHINMKGVEYYQNLTNELHKYRIEAIGIMYYKDLPQALQDRGGWTNPEIVSWFEQYARLLFTLLPTVNYWIPIHEPSVCFQMYDSRANVAPGLDAKGTDDYLCVKHMLLAHAKAYRIFFDELKVNRTTGRVGLALNLNWADPVDYDTNDPELKETTQILRDFTIDLYLHPFYSRESGFPKSVKQIVARNSRQEGLERSRLPSFTKAELNLLRGANDFIGVNHYTSFFVEKPPKKGAYSYPHLPKDVKVKLSQHSGWTESKTPGIKSAPYAIHRLCVYLNQRFDRPPVILTEFGFSTDPGRRDHQRVEVIIEFFKAIILALIDMTDFRGFTMWSLMDTIEWTDGANYRYGLYEVDFDSPTKNRRPRLSAHYFRSLVETHKIKEIWQPYSKDLSLRISPRKSKAREKTEL